MVIMVALGLFMKKGINPATLRLIWSRKDLTVMFNQLWGSSSSMEARRSLPLILMSWRSTRSSDSKTHRRWSMIICILRKKMMERVPNKLKCWVKPYCREESGQKNSNSPIKCCLTSFRNSDLWWTSPAMKHMTNLAPNPLITYSQWMLVRKWHN